MDLLVKIKNPNYGSFKYKQTGVDVKYQGIVVGLVPLEPRLVPDRNKLNFGISSVDLSVYKMLESPKFVEDASIGSFNFSSFATLRGKVKVLKVLKFHAKVFCTCDVSFFIMSQNITSICTTKIKL